METITLKYNKNKASIKKAIELLVTLGAEVEYVPNETTRKAIEDARAGNTLKFSSFEDYKAKTK